MRIPCLASPFGENRYWGLGGAVDHNEQNQGLNPELPSPRPPRYSGKQPWEGSSYTPLAQSPPPCPHYGLLINRGFQHLDVTCLRHAPSGPSFERTSDPAHPFQSASPAQSQARELFVPLLIMCPPASAFPGCPQGRVLSELLPVGSDIIGWSAVSCWGRRGRGPFRSSVCPTSISCSQPGNVARRGPPSGARQRGRGS